MTTPTSDSATAIRQKFRDDAFGSGRLGEYWIPVGLAQRLAEIVTVEQIIHWDSDAQNENGTFRGSFVLLTAELCISAAMVQDASERFKEDLRSAIVTVRRLSDAVGVVLDGQDRVWAAGSPLSGSTAIALQFPPATNVALTLGGLSNLDLRPTLPQILAAAGFAGRPAD